MNGPQHISVAYDGSPHSELALHRALNVAKTTPFGRVHVVCVVEDVAPHLVRLPNGVVMTSWSARESLRLIVSRSAKECGAVSLKRRVESHLRSGDPARVIVDLAYRFHSDQIFVGARGNGGIGRDGVGRVAAEVLELSDIPVNISMPLKANPARQEFNAVRWAYVFGGPDLRQGTLGANQRKSSSRDYAPS